MDIVRLCPAVLVLAAAAFLGGYLFERMRMPRVVGEVCAGFALGPSFFGFFRPDIHAWVFQGAAGGKILLSWLCGAGIALLMFISGYELQQDVSREDRKHIFVLLLGGIAVPCAAGWVMPLLCDPGCFSGPSGNLPVVRLAVAAALAVTGVPFLSRIFIDAGVIAKRFAKLVLVTAAVQDLIVWGFVFFAVHLARAGTPPAGEGSLGIGGVYVIFGSLAAGALIRGVSSGRFEKVYARIKRYAFVTIIPVAFALMGMQVDIVRHFDAGFVAVLFIVFTLIKGASIFVAAGVVSKSWLSRLNFAVAMNTRGSVGMMLAMVAFNQGIISGQFFTALMFFSLATVVFAGYWFQCAAARRPGSLA